MGCNWNVKQIKKYDTLNFSECLIVDDEGVCPPVAPPPPPSPIIPDNKYLKMMKMGIPIGAIKNNLVRDGYNVDHLSNKEDVFRQQLITGNIPKSENNRVPNITDLLLVKSGLKKTRAKANPKKKSFAQDGFAPTLDDILKIKNKLKKPRSLVAPVASAPFAFDSQNR